VKRAVEVFALEVRSSPSRLVGDTWLTRSGPGDSGPEGCFVSVAASHWEMVVTRQGGAARLTVRGPETKATTVPIPRGAEHFGIELSHGTFMPELPPGRLTDRTLTFPAVTGRSFRFHGSEWELPGPEDADTFIDELARAGVLVHDPVVPRVLRGDDAPDLSTRSVERRVARATGLSRGAIERIRRAERAVELLSQGLPASDVAHTTGYADQPHLTRSLKRLVGQTPAAAIPTATASTRCGRWSHRRR
jgi:hypothetical protein